jgi:hypothetical protein
MDRVQVLRYGISIQSEIGGIMHCYVYRAECHNAETIQSAELVVAGSATNAIVVFAYNQGIHCLGETHIYVTKDGQQALATLLDGRQIRVYRISDQIDVPVHRGYLIRMVDFLGS